MPLLSYNRIRRNEPELRAAEKISQALVKAGIQAQPAVRAEKAPPGTKHPTVITVESPPVAWLAEKAGHDSDNWVADSLTSAIGAQLKWRNRLAGGVHVITQMAQERSSEIQIINGSGLELSNFCSPRALVTFLHAMNTHQLAAEFKAVLPGAGEEGTLEYRMRNTGAVGSVRAKTGTLTREKKPAQDSLAGYCTIGGRTLAFAFILMKAATRYAARSSLDRMVDRLVRYCHAEAA